MKKVSLFFSILISPLVVSYGQCCPYVDPIEIIPASPSEADNIYVVTNVTTPNLGEYLGYQIIDQGSTIRIEACYYSGMLTALQGYTDTINLGVKPAGTYNILFVAYQSGSNTMCTYSDSNSVSATTTVSFLSVQESDLSNSFSIYPNPVTNNLVYITDKNVNAQLNFRLYNVLGELVLEGTTTNNSPIHVDGYRGVYFLSVSLENEVFTERILIL